MGINAHINFDLVLTIYDMLKEEWSQLSDLERQDRYEDHVKVNDIIYNSIDAVQDTIIEKEHPSMDIIDKLFGRVDEYLLSRFINPLEGRGVG